MRAAWNGDRPPWAIGIDVGGTKIAAGLVALSSGQVLARRRLPTGAGRGAAAVLADTVALAEELVGAARALGGEVAGIGVGVPELVDRAGAVRSAHALPWEGVPVGAAFAHLAPAVVEADVRAAALAEARYGTGRGVDPFAYLSVGTGISACLVRGGRPDVGARGAALVLATGPLTFPCPACGAAEPFRLESFAAGPALAARYAAATGRPVAGGEAVTAAAERGDAAAVEIVRTAAAALGSAVGWLVNVTDPAAVVVGGGLGLAGGRYWEGFVRATREHVWNDAARGLPIVAAALGADAGLVGAALAAVGREDLAGHRARIDEQLDARPATA